MRKDKRHPAPSVFDEARAVSLLLDVKCDSSSDKESILELAKLLVAAKELSGHWQLIEEIHRDKSELVYRQFAHTVASSWIGKGEKAHSWQVWSDIPRNLRFTAKEQRLGYAGIVAAAKKLERALQYAAIPISLRDVDLGFVALAVDSRVESNAMATDEFLKATHLRPNQVPVVAIPLACSKRDDDSILRRLIDVAKASRPVHAKGWIGQPKKISQANQTGARETYFARAMTKMLLYESESKKLFRPRIRDFVADLINTISMWEGIVTDCDSEWVRQAIR